MNQLTTIIIKVPFLLNVFNGLLSFFWSEISTLPKALNMNTFATSACHPNLLWSKANKCIDWLPASSKVDSVFIDGLNGELWAESDSQPSSAQPRSNTLSPPSSEDNGRLVLPVPTEPFQVSDEIPGTVLIDLQRVVNF